MHALLYANKGWPWWRERQKDWAGYGKSNLEDVVFSGQASLGVHCHMDAAVEEVLVNRRHQSGRQRRACKGQGLGIR
jgi:hypothetical protein